jgi:large conductance mechanosensitive channel
MFKEFKKFIMGGNVIEFAVAVIMAGAIGLVVKGFVSMIVMPFVSHFTGGVSFKEWKFILDEAILDAEGKIATAENAVMYGQWIDTIINLLIVGLVMFLIVKAYNKLKKKEEEAPAKPAATPEDIQLLREIRDSLKK